MNIQTSVITEERRPQNAKQRAREKKKWERLQAKINKLGGNKYTPGLFGWFLQQIGYKHTQQQIQAHQPAKSSKTQCSHGIFGIYVFSQKRAHITQRTNNFFWGVSISSEMGNWKANRTESEVSDRKTIHSGETWLRQGHKRGVKRFNIRAMKKATRWFNSFKRYIIWGLKQFSCLRKSASICRSTVNAFGGAHKPYAHWNDKWLSLFHSLSLFLSVQINNRPKKNITNTFHRARTESKAKKSWSNDNSIGMCAVHKLWFRKSGGFLFAARKKRNNSNNSWKFAALFSRCLLDPSFSLCAHSCFFFALWLQTWTFCSFCMRVLIHLVGK